MGEADNRYWSSCFPTLHTMSRVTGIGMLHSQGLHSVSSVFRAG
jgi:hypothetical protein